MNNSNFSHLTSESVLVDLPASNFRVSPETLGRVVSAEFHNQPDLPGVLICRGNKLEGMICAGDSWSS